MFLKTLRFLSTAAILTAATLAAHAQFPERPVKVVAPMAAGGGTDAVARVFAQKFAERLGSSVIVENRPGGGGQLGAELVAAAPPDGHTVLFASSGALTLPYLRKTKFDLQRDFVPVGQVGVGNYVVIINPKLPYRTLQEFIAAAKANPGKFTYGSAGLGSGSHLSVELFEARTGVKLVHVPFKSSNEATTAMIGGVVDCAIDVLTIVKPHIDAGTVRGLATTGAVRDPGMPNLPTVNEAKIAAGGYEMTFWYGMFLPIKTPRPVVERMQREFAVIMKDPEILDRVKRFSVAPSTLNAVQFQANIAEETNIWKKIIADGKIEAN